METSNEFNLQTPNEFTPPPSLPSTPKLGIASLALGIIGLILYFIPFIVGFISGISGFTIAAELSDTINIFGWFVSWCGNFLGLIALILGGISVTREKKKIFGIVGIGFGALLTCGCLATLAYNLSQM